MEDQDLFDDPDEFEPDEPAESADEPDDPGDVTEAEAGSEGDESEPEPTAETEDLEEEPHQPPIEAIQKVRKRAQEAERKLAEAQGKLSVFKAREPDPSKDDSDPDDEFYGKGPAKYTDDKLQAAKAEFDQQLERVREDFALARSQMSAEMVRAQHDDFDQVVGELKEAAEKNPMLAALADDEVRKASNPALAAYKMAKKYADMRGLVTAVAPKKGNSPAQKQPDVRPPPGRRKRAASTSLASVTDASDVSPAEPEQDEQFGDLFG